MVPQDPCRGWLHGCFFVRMLRLSSYSRSAATQSNSPREEDRMTHFSHSSQGRGADRDRRYAQGNPRRRVGKAGNGRRVGEHRPSCTDDRRIRINEFQAAWPSGLYRYMAKIPEKGCSHPLAQRSLPPQAPGLDRWEPLEGYCLGLSSRILCAARRNFQLAIAGQMKTAENQGPASRSRGREVSKSRKRRIILGPRGSPAVMLAGRHHAKTLPIKDER